MGLEQGEVSHATTAIYRPIRELAKDGDLVFAPVSPSHRFGRVVEDINAPELNGWLAYLRKTPGSRGKPRSQRMIQTYARSARAFFHWLVRRELIVRNPFDRVTFPKVGKPLIQTIDLERVSSGSLSRASSATSSLHGPS